MMSAPRIEIPIDEENELMCAGLAAVGRNSARDLLARLDPADLYFPQHRRIVEHALDPTVLAAEDAAESLDRLAARIVALSSAAGVPTEYVQQLAADAAFGLRVIAPRRVTLAARKRELMQACADVYNGAANLSVDGVNLQLDHMAELRNQIAALGAPRFLVLTGGGA